VACRSRSRIVTTRRSAGLAMVCLGIFNRLPLCGGE
jgi:hypothetical protein